MTWSQTLTAVCLAGALLAGCERGPMQKAGEKVDDAIGQDKLIGKGPVEKAGKKVDEATKDLRK